MMYAVVRIRGTINARRAVRDTLDMLNLKKVNTCTLIPDTPSYRGMLQQVKDYVTWGEVSEETVRRLLERARVEDADGAQRQLADGASLKAVCQPGIGLHPPRKGYRSIKKPFHMGGSAGYRGDHINQLIERML
jgi:large subunit ribosomal protein L30